MLSKGKMNILLGLCLVSLTSVGFSSWIIGTTSTTVQGNITADNVINSKEYIYLDTTKGDSNTGIKMFSYFDTGFIDDDGRIVDEGHIVAYYKLDLAKCKSFFTNCSSLDLQVILKYSSDNASAPNLFLDNSYHSLTHTISTTVSYTSSSIEGRSNKQYIIPLSFNNILSNQSSSVDITFDYAFTIDKGQYFNENVFDYLHNGLIDFSISTKLTAR